MQGMAGLLSVVTYPVGAGLKQRIVIDGPRGAIFEYDASNNLVGTWAATAGTDPYGHTYTAGFTISPGTPGSGIKVTFATTAPANPNVGDLWYDTSNGAQIHQWNGTVWGPFQYGTAAIANGAITAPLMAAGIVVAGIVDATTINAATFTGGTFNGTDFIINANGAWFYSGTPAANNLIASITVGTVADPFGNKPPGGGVCVYDLTAAFAAIQCTGTTIRAWSATGENGPWSQSGPAIRLGGSATTFPAPVVVGATTAATSADFEVNALIGIRGRTAPGTPPAGDGYLYVNSGTGALHYKGPSGTDTQIAAG